VEEQETPLLVSEEQMALIQFSTQSHPLEAVQVAVQARQKMGLTVDQAVLVETMEPQERATHLQ
jgi:hypothetical protein